MKINKRETKKFLVYPRIQLRFAWMYLGLLTFVIVVFTFLSQFVLVRVENLINNPDDLVTLRQWRSNLLWVEIFIGVLSGVFIVLFTIMVTHRFVGPIKGFIRYFEKVKKGEPAELSIRHYDGLEPLVDYLKTVDIEVRDKQPKSGLQT